MSKGAESKDQPLGEEYLLPHERSGDAVLTDQEQTAQSLFDLLGSDPEFADSEEPEKTDEPADPDQSESESEDAEPESEEPEDTAPDDKSEDPEQPEEETEEPQMYEFTVNGETVRATLEELQAGFSRNKDYTVKTQRLADQRRELESEASKVTELREAYGQRIEELDDLLSKASGPEPNWAELEKGDPAEYAATYAKWQRAQSARDKLRTERARLRQEQQEEAQTQHAQRVAEASQKLVEEIPEWKDRAKREAGQEAVRKYAYDLGFTDQQLAQVADHRIFQLFRKAMLHDQATTKGRKVIQQAKAKPAKVLQPGKPRDRKGAVRKVTQEKINRLKSTGSVKDAAAVFYDLLSDTD